MITFQRRGVAIQSVTVTFQRKGAAIQRETIAFQRKGAALQRETITFQRKGAALQLKVTGTCKRHIFSKTGDEHLVYNMRILTDNQCFDEIIE